MFNFRILLIFFVYTLIKGEMDNDILNSNQNFYQQKFSDILLIIHFNHPFYANINFIKKLYSPIFKHIVFYGEKKHQDVINITTHQGFYFSRIMSDVLKRFPNYQGYLFLQDDCVFHFWSAKELDLNKIWFAVQDNNKVFFIINPIILKIFFQQRVKKDGLHGINHGGLSLL